MIYTVTLNPALDKTVEIPSMTVDRVNRITSMRTDPGGKGINVSKVLRKLGGRSIACGILAGHTGESILSALHEMGIETLFYMGEGETRTNLKIVDPVCHTNTDINEPGITVTAQMLAELLGALTQRAVKGDIVVLTGSVPRGAPKYIYGTWGRSLSQKGAKIFLDADGELLRYGLRAEPFLVKPNNYELSALMGQELTEIPEIRRAAAALIKEYNVRRVVVSMGERGALYVSKGECIYAKGLKVPVGSTVGAGDSVVAALAFAEEKGMSLGEAARLSTAAGAANVMCSGSQAAEYETIQELLGKVKLNILE